MYTRLHTHVNTDFVMTDPWEFLRESYTRTLYVLESVEERLQSWRQAQQYKYEHQSPIDAANPRQEDGKLKLLASVGKGSIAMFFFLLFRLTLKHPLLKL